MAWHWLERKRGNSFPRKRKNSTFGDSTGETPSPEPMDAKRQNQPRHNHWGDHQTKNRFQAKARELLSQETEIYLHGALVAALGLGEKENQESADAQLSPGMKSTLFWESTESANAQLCPGMKSTLFRSTTPLGQSSPSSGCLGSAHPYTPEGNLTRRHPPMHSKPHMNQWVDSYVRKQPSILISRAPQRSKGKSNQGLPDIWEIKNKNKQTNRTWKRKAMINK